MMRTCEWIIKMKIIPGPVMHVNSTRFFDSFHRIVARSSFGLRNVHSKYHKLQYFVRRLDSRQRTFLFTILMKNMSNIPIHDTFTVRYDPAIHSPVQLCVYESFESSFPIKFRYQIEQAAEKKTFANKRKIKREREKFPKIF